MTAKESDTPEHKAQRERRKNLTDQQLKDLELAGGVEGGMQAGSAGGPGQSQTERAKSAGEPATADRPPDD